MRLNEIATEDKNRKAFEYVLTGGLEGKTINGLTISNWKQVHSNNMWVYYDFTIVDSDRGITTFGKFVYVYIGTINKYQVRVIDMFWQYNDRMHEVSTSRNLAEIFKIIYRDENWYAPLNLVTARIHEIFLNVDPSQSNH